MSGLVLVTAAAGGGPGPASPEDWEHWWLGVTRQRIPRAANAAGTGPPLEGRGPSWS